MRTAVALVALVAIGGVALGQVVAPPSPAPTPAADVKDGAGATKAVTGKKGKRVRRPRVAGKPAETAQAKGSLDTVTGCLELWEPATHMTRREWARACRRVAARIDAATLN
jgi:hypothetical protein